MTPKQRYITLLDHILQEIDAINEEAAMPVPWWHDMMTLRNKVLVNSNRLNAKEKTSEELLSTTHKIKGS